MAHTENQKKLLKIPNEMFQLDEGDLDFGIYCFMNTKNQKIKLHWGNSDQCYIKSGEYLYGKY